MDRYLKGLNMEKSKRPNFSGTWRFNRAKSVLQIAPPDSTVFVIHHHEPDVELSRIHRYGQTTDTFAIRLHTGGETIATNHRDLEIRARAYWDGDELVFCSELTSPNDRGTNIVRYRLSNQGQTITAAEDMTSSKLKYSNTWILDRE